jgi:hypothetical protein
MNKIIGLIIIGVFLFFTACGGSSEEPVNQQEIVIVTDSLSVEMEELKEGIEQALVELEKLLDEIE